MHGKRAADNEAKDAAQPLISKEASLIRDLSLFDVTMVGVGAMIGAGIFVLTGIAAGTATGPPHNDRSQHR